MVSIGAMIGSPARAAVLGALLDGRALTATELARLASVSSPATASLHLAKLVDSGLLLAERHGRHRYYRIAGAEVAEALRTLARLGVAQRAPVRAPSKGAERRSSRPSLLRPFRGPPRRCDHLPAMLDRGWLEPMDRDYRLTPSGEVFCCELGIDLRAVRAKRRTFARKCLDWSERRPHLAGRTRRRPGRAGVRSGLGEAGEATARGFHHSDGAMRSSSVTLGISIRGELDSEGPGVRNVFDRSRRYRPQTPESSNGARLSTRTWASSRPATRPDGAEHRILLSSSPPLLRRLSCR